MDNKLENYDNGKLEEALPMYLLVEGIHYKRYITYLLNGGVQIGYCEFDGMLFNWSNKGIHKQYEISDIIPIKEECLEDQLCDGTVYKFSIEEVILDFLESLKKWNENIFNEPVPTEVLTKESKFHRDLTSLINKYSKENESNTPDFLLANYLVECLGTFNRVINSRESWYGRISGMSNNEINLNEDGK